MKRLSFLAIVFVIIFSCEPNDQIGDVERAFYYWKNDHFNEVDLQNLELAETEKLYIKLFEVDYNEANGNFPYCKNHPKKSMIEKLDSVEIVPTIFIRNSIFQFNTEQSLNKLADDIVFLINKYSFESGYNRENSKIFDYNEIQIDCDWTISTRDKYFYLLKKIKEISSKQISCTLRLYPYKYPDIMGVPPVDKVTLMCYNLIKPLTEKYKNSILDIDELKLYLNRKESYPLHLDIALPTFYWAQHYQNNQFQNLIELNKKDVSKWAKNIEPFWYIVERDTVLENNIFLKSGDQLKCEEVSTKTLLEAINIIRDNVDLEWKTTVSLFDLDQATFNQYTSEDISSFYTHFTD